jgi:hypothetical protein
MNFSDIDFGFGHADDGSHMPDDLHSLGGIGGPHEAHNMHDPLIDEANSLMDDTHHLVEEVRQHANEHLVAEGLKPMTEEFLDDLHAHIDNRIEMSDRAALGDEHAQHWIEQHEIQDHRNAAVTEAYTHEQQARNEVNQINEWVADGDRWLHEHEMERDCQHQAEHATNASELKEWLDQSKHHREEADRIEQERRGH